MRHRILAFSALAASLLVSCVQQGEYRNLAHFRAAYQSSQADYDLAAQLVTDGIVSTSMPVFITETVNGEDVPLTERAWAPDWCRWSRLNIDTCDASYVYRAAAKPVVLDALRLYLDAQWDKADDAPCDCSVEMFLSRDGQTWD